MPERKTERPYGWEVEAEFSTVAALIPGLNSNEKKTFAYRGCSQTAAIRRVKTKKRFVSVVKVCPLTEEQFIQAYGIGRM